MSDVPSPRDRRFADAAPAEPPEGPVGVWLAYADGTRIEDIPTIYLGVDEFGLHIWQTLSPRDEPPVGAGMKILPARTTVVIPRLQRKESM